MVSVAAISLTDRIIEFLEKSKKSESKQEIINAEESMSKV